MSDTISILYPSGAHGNFLSVVLNAMLGNRKSTSKSASYDDSEFEMPSIFNAQHHNYQVSPPVINIRVADTSMLKYCAACLNRTSVMGISLDILLENLNVDTFAKLRRHPIFKSFIPSLAKLSQSDTDQDVPMRYLREWARLCFFDNNCNTMRQWMETCQIDNPDYVFDFEYFYNGQLKNHCIDVLYHFGFKPITDDIDNLINDFEKNNRYRLIDSHAHAIMQNILQQNDTELKSQNFLVEAWIDQWLKINFNVEPILQDSYFTTTKSLISYYQLDSKELL